MTTPPKCAHQPRKNEGRPHPADSHGFSANAPECLQAGLRAHGRCVLSKENTSASRLPDGAAPDKIRNTNPSVAAVFAVKRGCMKCRHPITVAGAAKACSTVDRSTLFPFHALAWTPADACRAQALLVPVQDARILTRLSACCSMDWLAAPESIRPSAAPAAR